MTANDNVLYIVHYFLCQKGRISDECFKGCENLHRLLIPSTISYIGASSFSRCKSLSEIIIPSSVISIESNAFNECISLKSILLPSSITSIGSYAFCKCSSLKQINIPESVTSIGQNAFEECVSLMQIRIPSSMKVISQGVFNKCKSLLVILIPFSITSIEPYAFCKCSSLKQISIPESVTSIGQNAFEECVSLMQIRIPSSMKVISQGVFNKCKSLSNVLIPSSIIEIQSHSFRECISLKEITIPPSVVEIGKNTFDGCKSLVKISISQSVKSIGGGAFYGCQSLEEILIPTSITTISDHIFYECSSLKQIEIHSSVKSIEQSSFKKCVSLEKIIFEEPSSLESIGKGAFGNCVSLKQLTIPSSVKSIGKKSFYGCSSLSKINQLIHLDFLGEDAFGGCPLITIAFNIPHSIDQNFQGQNAQNMTNINYPIIAYSKSSSLTAAIKPLIASSPIFHLYQESANDFHLSEAVIDLLNRCGCSSLGQNSIPLSVLSNCFAPSGYSSSTRSLMPSYNMFNVAKFFNAFEDNFFNMNLRIIKKIGQCDYYQTFLVENSQIKMKYAANIFYENLVYYSNESRNKAISVLNSLMKIDHTSIIKYIDFNERGYDENHYSTLLTEPVNQESLEFYIQNGGMNSKGRVMNDTEKLITIYGIASAMSYLHSNEILHFDLRPANIIEDDDFHPKVINYGLKPIIRTIQNMMRIKDYSFYCAPEFYIDNKYTKSSEVYSFSLIAYEILTSQNLFENATIISHLENIQNGIRPSFNTVIPISLWNLITRCWSQNPEDRPTFDEILDELTGIAENLNSNEFKEYAEFIKVGHNSTGGEPKNEPGKSEKKTENNGDEPHANRNEGNVHLQVKDTKRRSKKKKNGGGDEEEEEEEEEKDEDGNGNEREEEEEEENEIIRELIIARINRINLELYVKGNIIGDGGYSIVYKANLLNAINDETFAAKVSKLNILDREMSDQFVKSFLSEVKIHSRLLNSSFIKFIGYSPQDFDLDKTKPTIMMEYAENGSLEDAILKMRFHQTKNSDNRESKSKEEGEEEDFYLNDTQKLIIIYGVSAAMKFLHSLNIIHRDLKPLNILLGKDFLPKVSDFGISIEESEVINEKLKVAKGTSAFIAPEIWKNQEYGKPSDVYAFAITVYELMTGKILFKGLEGPQIACQINILKFRPSVESLPKSYQNLIKCCWLEDKNCRPTFEQIVENLRTNEDFITENVDREIYHKFIKIIDENLG